MTVNPKSLENLTPAQPGEVRNPHGRPKGSKNLSSIIRELEDDNFEWDQIPMKQKDAVAKIGSPWRAIVYRAVAMAATGDIKAMKWLKDAGYGSKLTVEADEGFFSTPKIQIEIVQPNHDIITELTTTDDDATDTPAEASADSAEPDAELPDGTTAEDSSAGTPSADNQA